LRPLQKHFLQHITALHGAHNLAVLIHTISALALRAPLALSRAALAAVLTGMPFTGNAVFTINTFAKASV
jgi:hypothetical protein